MKTRIDHARDHLHTLPLAVSGQGGHNTTFSVACSLARRFALSEEELLTLMGEYNGKLAEKWTGKELRHKVMDALREVREPRRPAQAARSVRQPWFKPLRAPMAVPRIEWKIEPRPLPTPAVAAEPHRQQTFVPSVGTSPMLPPVKSVTGTASPSIRPLKFPLPEETFLFRDVPQPPDTAAGPEIESPKPVADVQWEMIADADAVAEVATVFAAVQGPIALDIETYGPDKAAALDPWRGEIRLLSLAAIDQPPVLVDLRAVGYDLGALVEVLDGHEVIIQNASFDALWLRQKCGLRLPRIFCTMTAARLLHVGDKSRDNRLGTILEKYCGVSLPKDQGSSDWSAPALTPAQLAYAANDVAHLHALKTRLVAELDAAALNTVFQLEMDLLPVVDEMEGRGFAINSARLQEILGEAAALAQDARAKVQQELGIVNPGSQKQVLTALNERGLDLPNTSAETLAGCVHPAAILVLKHREADKRRQQAQTLLEHLRPDGRIHGRFNPMGAESGRFSSSEPNLQNVARGDLRSVLTAADGHVLVVADYSQIELRIAAAIADETTMIEAFRSGDDLHRLTAGTILGKAVSDVTPDERQLAKAVNFGLLFGQLPPGLRRYAKNSYGVEISENDACRFHARFFDAYPALRRWHEQARRRACNRNVREVRTVSGRRRLLPTEPGNEWARFTNLVNTPVQGAAADGMKRTMVTLARVLPTDAGIVSTVHDELIVECPVSKSDEVKDLLDRTMVDEMTVLFPQVPIEVETKVCLNWGEK